MAEQEGRVGMVISPDRAFPGDAAGLVAVPLQEARRVAREARDLAGA